VRRLWHFIVGHDYRRVNQGFDRRCMCGKPEVF